MKKTEFAELHSLNSSERLQQLEAGKQDEYDLPEFTKEVPISSKKKESGGRMTIEYEWKESASPTIKIKKLDYRKDNDLTGLYRVAARDGADSISFRYRNSTYILRKTAREIAQALYNAYGKIKGVVESIVGYLRTVLGNDYVISKVDNESWAFDRRIARGDLQYVDVDDLGRENRSNLVEMLTEKISALHSNNLIIGRFTLNNILLSENDLRLTDLRRLRVSRKRSYVIEEFKSILQYLFALGIATREDVYASLALYTAENEKSCEEWYENKTGGKPSEQLDLISCLENEIYS
jgi:hypothetical protein